MERNDKRYDKYSAISLWKLCFVYKKSGSFWSRPGKVGSRLKQTGSWEKGIKITELHQGTKRPQFNCSFMTKIEENDTILSTFVISSSLLAVTIAYNKKAILCFVPLPNSEISFHKMSVGFKTEHFWSQKD